jgi:hypothetical protein
LPSGLPCCSQSSYALWDGKSKLTYRLAIVEEIPDLAATLDTLSDPDADVPLFYLVPIDSKAEETIVLGRGPQGHKTGD